MIEETLFTDRYGARLVARFERGITAALTIDTSACEFDEVSVGRRVVQPLRDVLNGRRLEDPVRVLRNAVASLRVVLDNSPAGSDLTPGLAQAVKMLEADADAMERGAE